MRMLSVLCVFFALGSVQAAPLKNQNYVEVAGHRFQVEIARTPAEWARGLMYREKIGPFEGMLFVGKENRPQSFWMKNTPRSLDIIFISSDWTIVDIHSKAKPLSEDSIPSKFPAAHVLEILGGRSQELGIKVGNKVRWIQP